MNDADNAAFAAALSNFGRLALPALFVHAAWDTTLDKLQGDLAIPMREDCSALTEACCWLMVRVVGVEPTLLAEPDFESGASTNSTTPARAVRLGTGVNGRCHRRRREVQPS